MKNKTIKKYIYICPKQNINNHELFNVNTGKLLCCRCGNSSDLANFCKYTNTIRNICKKSGHLGKVYKRKDNNFKKQINVLNAVDILFVSYDTGGTMSIEIPVLMKNNEKADM